MKRIADKTGNSVLVGLSGPAVIFLVAGLLTNGGFSRPALCISCLSTAAAAFLLFSASKHMLKENFYSVNSVILPGLCLYAVCLSCVTFFLTLHITETDGSAQKLLTLWQYLRTAVMCTLPFILPFSVLLVISNITSILWLVRHGRGDVINFQGFLSAAVLCGSSAAVIFSDKYLSPAAAPWACPAILLYLFAECMLFTALAVLRACEKRRPGMDKDFLIILGCGMYSDGRPSSMLRNRMKAGLRHDQKQQETSGKQAVFIVSGGQGPDEICSEADTMKKWLMEQGVPEERILVEDRSRTTQENMAFSKEIIDAVDPGARTAFCTTNFHAFRAGIKAQKAGLDAEGVIYNTEWYFWYNAAVREVVGLLAEILLNK